MAAPDGNRFVQAACHHDYACVDGNLPHVHQPLPQRIHQSLNRHTHLRHGVALSDRDGLIFFDRLEIDGDAQRRADLVLAAVAPADALRIVVLDEPMLAQLRCNVARRRRQLLVSAQWQHRHFHRRQSRMQVQTTRAAFRFNHDDSLNR